MPVVTKSFSYAQIIYPSETRKQVAFSCGRRGTTAVVDEESPFVKDTSSVGFAATFPRWGRQFFSSRHICGVGHLRKRRIFRRSYRLSVWNAPRTYHKSPAADGRNSLLLCKNYFSSNLQVTLCFAVSPGSNIRGTFSGMGVVMGSTPTT